MLKITFTAEDKALARKLLEQCSVPRDRLPYSPEFEELYVQFYRQSGRHIDRAVFWRLLSSAAKLGGLAKRRRRAH